jgi:hypothetical protein
VARADLGDFVEIDAIIFSFTARAEDELAWRNFQFLLLPDHRHELNVVFRVTNHYTTQKVLPIEREKVLLVDGLKWIFVGKGLDRRRRWSISHVPGPALLPAAANAIRMLGRMLSSWYIFWPVSVSEEVTKACHLDPKQRELSSPIRLEGSCAHGSIAHYQVYFSMVR